MTDHPGTDDGIGTIVGRPPRQRRPIDPRVMAIFGLVYLLITIWALTRRRPDYFFLLYSLYFLVPVVQRLRPPTVVAASGIVRPWRRPSMLSWDDVASVQSPAPGIYPVRLTLHSGKGLSLEDIPATESAPVAALGGKRVEAVQRLVAAPRSSAGIRTAEQIEVDVTRQAQVLAEQRRQLAAESRRLRGDRS